MKRSLPLLLGLTGLLNATGAVTPSLEEQAHHALSLAVQYFQGTVGVNGTYLWQYSEDLTRREGEGVATPSQGWIQPPGTPSVGLAFLAAWNATHDQLHLDAARLTAHALAQGQLESGGWTYLIDFDPESRRPLAYRLRPHRNKRARNHTTLDDNTTQAALRFLVEMDQALNFEDPVVRETLDYALTHLLAAQYPNGAWPQGFRQAADPTQHAPQPATYPKNWSRQYPGGSYWSFYTFNDNVVADQISVLLRICEVYQHPNAPLPARQLGRQCRTAAIRSADFILLAQMPEPQPAWAQQYDFDMHPAWARKFEPPAISGNESQNLLETLLDVYRHTGNRKYLQPIQPALDYFRRSLRPDGRLARFYELKTNRPLYFTQDYQLTYSDADVPTHYSFVVSDRTPRIAREFDAVRELNPAQLAPSTTDPTPALTPKLEGEVRAIIRAQDGQGRWVEEGRLRYHGDTDPTRRVIRCATFIRNVQTLSDYLRALE